MRIVFIHLLNNYSGSPKVLSVLLRELAAKNEYRLKVLTSSGPGFLSDIAGVEYAGDGYRFFRNRILRLASWCWAQTRLFFTILGMSGRNTLFYVNTIMPIGAVWACRITGKRMVYHVHENMRQSKPLYGVCRRTYALCNRKTIFVSRYLENSAVNFRDSKVIYNSLDREFCEAATVCRHTGKMEAGRTVLMVASLKRYKGVYEFAELAKRFADFPFVLVVSAEPHEVKRFTDEVRASENLTVYPLQTNLHPFYRQARVVMQLSHPEECVETFGLTILEAMTYGVPVIGPNAGGPAEIIRHGVDGFLVNPLDLDEVSRRLKVLLTDEARYEQFVRNAGTRASEFETGCMVAAVENYLRSC